MKTLNIQQGSDEWLIARLEKISGTRVGRAIGSPAVRNTLLNELLAERLTGEPKDHYVNYAMERGTEAEPYAIDLYEEKSGNIVNTVGMCVHDKYSWLTNSPDGLIGDEGAVEIKCPNTDKAVAYLREEGLPKEYQAQVMSYFLVNQNLKWLDFVVYDPRIKDERYQITINRVKRPPKKELDNIIKKLLEFRQLWEAELKNLKLNF